MPRPATSLKSQTRREVVDLVAPHYRQASCAQKSLLLDSVVATTGYARKYAIGLLNQASERTQTIQHPPFPQYSSEVQNALFQAWSVTNWICAKRLIPFLPTLVDALERHEHLHLTEESRNHLLQVSASTAERFLHAQRHPAPHGLSTTKTGPLLKQQIPLRTFEQWDETRPGFLEADLVAHCGGQSEGSFLYTLTLTDIATGWTECLPLLYRSPEAVHLALLHARTLFPFPILGLDTDNGKEFLNETILAYCEREHLTFTRGRPGCKNDQCFVEQKNGAIVRQFVGHDRFVGVQAYRQLCEVYRALRLYVNCFQPSMKLHSKYHDGKRIRRVYDPAKTPLQRLLLSGILSASQQQELSTAFQALDPLALFQQGERLQQAMVRNAANSFSSPLRMVAPTLLRFSSDQCFRGSLPIQDPETSDSLSSKVSSLLPDQRDFLDWPRTTRDPFEGAWEQILCWVLAHPEYSSGDLFQLLQQESPERYHSSQLGTLQRGVRKIRAHLLHLMEEPCPHEVIQARSKPDQREHEGDLLQEQGDAPSLPQHSRAEEVVRGTSVSIIPVANICNEQPMEEGRQASLALEVARSPFLGQESPQIHLSTITIEGTIALYLQEQKGGGRGRKTLEWHQTALGLWQQYLVDECHLGFLHQITSEEVRGWLAFLRTPSSTTGRLRGASTIATYGRSVRAFCHWAVQKGYLDRTPMGRGILPKTEKKRIHLIEPTMFERLLLACRPRGDVGFLMDRDGARNRAILWVLLDTGMRASELCGLCLSDVDREKRSLRVEGNGKARWLMLSPSGWDQVLSYLEWSRPKEISEGRAAEEVPLFFSETYQPLTINALTLLCGRLRKRAGLTEIPVNPSVLRDTFAVRYLLAGGDPEGLREILGLAHVMSVTCYQRLIDGQREKQKESATEEQLERRKPGPYKRRPRWRKTSSATIKGVRGDGHFQEQIRE